MTLPQQRFHQQSPGVSPFKTVKKTNHHYFPGLLSWMEVRENSGLIIMISKNKANNIMNKTSLVWHLIYTMPQQEKKVAARLFDMNIASFLPLVKTVRQWHDRKKVIETPLFPSYVFININNTYDYFNIVSLDGVITFVKTGKELAKVNPTIINNIQIALSNCDNPEITSNRFTLGVQLVITKGPFAGLSCEMIRYKGKDKALIRITILDRNIIIDIPTDHISQSLNLNIA